MGKFVDLVGQKFGRLTVVSRVKRERLGTYWLCCCDCGLTKEVRTSSLKAGSTKSCGCLYKEVAGKQGVMNATHGMSGSRVYNVWRNMIQRCTDQNSNRFDSYGERGITVCDEWRKSFDSFYSWATDNGYREDLQIDRRDNDGNYCPENCRFVMRPVNITNRGKMRNNTSGYVGVSYNKKGRVWESTITTHQLNMGRQVYIGRASSKQQALEVRNQFIRDNNLLHRIQEWGGE